MQNYKLHTKIKNFQFKNVTLNFAFCILNFYDLVAPAFALTSYGGQAALNDVMDDSQLRYRYINHFKL